MQTIHNTLAKLGFKKSRDGFHDRENVRVVFDAANTQIHVYVFVGAPGWSPVRNEVTFTDNTPAAVIVATIKATVQNA